MLRETTLLTDEKRARDAIKRVNVMAEWTLLRRVMRTNARVHTTASPPPFLAAALTNRRPSYVED